MKVKKKKKEKIYLFWETEFAHKSVRTSYICIYDLYSDGAHLPASALHDRIMQKSEDGQLLKISWSAKSVLKYKDLFRQWGPTTFQ